MAKQILCEKSILELLGSEQNSDLSDLSDLSNDSDDDDQVIPDELDNLNAINDVIDNYDIPNVDDIDIDWNIVDYENNMMVDIEHVNIIFIVKYKI